ncbi:MAG: helix-turn-helix domain-containing protein [Victivallales bacterium]|nr:helix-turn-helix domain-containing protein [Victivallales bacterium]
MNSKVTPVGRFLRKLRIDCNEVLYDMAQKLKCSSAFISALELGKRPVPSEFQQNLTSVYQLSEVQQQEFQQSIEQSAKSISLNLEELPEGNRDLALVFARRLKTMEEKEAEKLLNWLNKTSENTSSKQEHK